MALKVDVNLESLLGSDYESLLFHRCQKIDKKSINVPSPDFIEKVFYHSNRNIQTLRSLSNIFQHGRLKSTGYISILPVDQGIEHSAGASFAHNQIYFDPENIIKLAIEGGCNAVATTFGNFGIVARKYAHKIPFIVKINHNESLIIPKKPNQILFGSVIDAWNLGACAIGATIYFCSPESDRQIAEIAEAFELAHELGMATILWCYPRNKALITKEKDYHAAADITSQCNYIGSTLQADFIKQKLPNSNYGFTNLNFSNSNFEMYENLSTMHPIDLCRYQVANCYMGKIGLINSGGASKGAPDLAEAIRTAIINKRAGGMGLILGRKAFQKPFEDGVKILHAIQDVYLTKEIDIA